LRRERRLRRPVLARKSADTCDPSWLGCISQARYEIRPSSREARHRPSQDTLRQRDRGVGGGIRRVLAQRAGGATAEREL